MSDVEAISAVVTGVSHFIDRRDFTRLRALFADTVETDYRSLFGGEIQQQPADALMDAWKGLLSPIVTQHLLGPVTVAVSGASATAECHVRAYHHAKGTPGGDEWMVAGHYVFGLEKSGSWRIGKMKLETYYQSGNLELLQMARR